MMQDLIQLEQKVQAFYDQTLLPLAGRTGFLLPKNRPAAPRQPSVLFLGNHSSGKSSFINHLIQADLQKTGLAPTDDGFTIITYGDKPDSCDGHTLVTHPSLSYQDLQPLGPAFLARLRLKTHPHELLRSVTLIDSPGMIDSAGAAPDRGYDFAACVRLFAERADLILFFFDPDKPGTTGETMSIFTDALADLAYKLMIVLHKVDLFGSIRDFARTYGTLCWNLSKTIQSKDIPHIFTTYLPNLRQPGPGGHSPALALEDFDLSREEVIAEIKRAPTRHADNLVSGLYQNGQRLAVHVRVCQAVAASYRARRRFWWAGMFLTLVGTALAAWLSWDPLTLGTCLLVLCGGLLMIAGLWFLSDYFLKRFTARTLTPEALEAFFHAAHHRELTLSQRADLQGWWETVRDDTLAALRALGLAKIPRPLATRRSFQRLERVLEEEIPKLRRAIL